MPEEDSGLTGLYEDIVQDIGRCRGRGAIISDSDMYVINSFLERVSPSIKPPKDKAETEKRWAEIPDQLKAFSLIVIRVAKSFKSDKFWQNTTNKQWKDRQCFVFRQIVGKAFDEFKEAVELEMAYRLNPDNSTAASFGTVKIDFKMPVPRHRYGTDGYYIPPDWFVRATNGIVTWKGDMSCDHCDGGETEATAGHAGCERCSYKLTTDQLSALEAEIFRRDHNRTRLVIEDIARVAK